MLVILCNGSILYTLFFPLILLICQYIIVQDYSVCTLLTFFAEYFFVVGDAILYCRIFSSIPTLFQIDANSTSPPICDNETCPPKLPKVPWGTISISLKNHCLKYQIYYIPFFFHNCIILICVHIPLYMESLIFFHQSLIDKHFGLSNLLSISYHLSYSHFHLGDLYILSLVYNSVFVM